MRHTFASFGIAAGVSLFYLARLMGTSVEQIDSVYGHLLPDSEDYLRGLLEAFDAQRQTPRIVWPASCPRPERRPCPLDDETPVPAGVSL